MVKGIHNFSEIGKLNKVLLHRPGLELEALTPSTIERLLFDDIPYLKIAQEEHDKFANTLRDNGVEVVYYVEEAGKAMSDPAIQIQFVNDFLNLSKINSKGLRLAMTQFLLEMPPEEMVRKVIAGIKREEVATKDATSLMDLVRDDYPFVSDPMPNLYFTRDPGACVGEGINIHHMHTDARRRESLILRYIYRYSRDFAKEGEGGLLPIPIIQVFDLFFKPFDQHFHSFFLFLFSLESGFVKLINDRGGQCDDQTE